MNKQKLKVLWIPAEILLNADLSDKEKIVLSMILYLSAGTGSCLSSDRLEYTLSNGLGATEKIWTLDDVKGRFCKVGMRANLIWERIHL